MRIGKGSGEKGRVEKQRKKRKLEERTIAPVILLP